MSESGSHGPALSVIVATHGRRGLLGRLLESLSQPDNRKVLAEPAAELLVVENGPASGARDACLEAADALSARYHHVEEIGKSAALNFALDRAEGGFLCFFDDDVRVADGILSVYRGAAARYGRGHFFGGCLHVDREVDPPAWLEPYLPTSVTGWHPDGGEGFINEPDFLGANWGAYREDIESVGGFATFLGPTPRYRALDEETELQVRMLEAGKRAVYLPNAEVWHHVPAEMSGLAWARRRMYQQYLSKSLRGEFRVDPPRIAGAPRWLYRRCLEDFLAWSSAILARKPESARVARDMAWARSSGRLVGHWRARRTGEGVPGSP